MMKLGTKGGVGIVASERNNFSWHFIQSLLNVKEKMPGLMIIHSQVGNIAEARNAVLKIAKQAKLDWVVMIDSDMTFQSTAILQLIDTMESMEATVGAGLYFGTFPPYAPMASELIDGAYRFVKDYSKPRLIDGCGMGFTLITKELFDIQFEFAPGIGEDYDFCRKAQNKGFKVILDPDVRCGHLRVIPIDERMIKVYFKGNDLTPDKIPGFHSIECVSGSYRTYAKKNDELVFSEWNENLQSSMRDLMDKLWR